MKSQGRKIIQAVMTDRQSDLNLVLVYANKDPVPPFSRPTISGIAI